MGQRAWGKGHGAKGKGLGAKGMGHWLENGDLKWENGDRRAGQIIWFAVSSQRPDAICYLPGKNFA